MELLEFKNKVFEILDCKNTSEIGNKLLKTVIENNSTVYEQFKHILSDKKDWLQSLWQYYEADRTEKKQDYTPKSLCKLVSAFAGESYSVYDCCGGSGALTLEMIRNHNIKNIYVEELDENVIPFLLFNLALVNANGYVVNCDVLTREKKKAYKLKKGEKYSFVTECLDFSELESAEKQRCDVAISNPPYNIKWKLPMQSENNNMFPVIPPAGNANWAFVFNCLSRADRAVMILPNGILSERTEEEIRKYFVDKDLIETVAVMPEKMFEITSISTCILVINKHKQNKGFIKFIDSRKNCITEEREQNGQYGGTSHTNRTYKKTFNILSDENINKILNAPQSQPEFSATIPNEIISQNNYFLVPSKYIEFEEREQTHRDFQEIADNINYISRMQNACKLVINETIAKQLGFDKEIYKESKENSAQIQERMKAIGINVEVEDYIQFTKNKNEFMFKCNDKELMPDILLHFLMIWKNQIALLNTMQNQYLAELRDALLPDLMSGKIDVSTIQ